MNALLIAVDDPRRPKRSALIAGPELRVDEVRKRFAEAKASGLNPSGLPWVQLWTAEGPQIAHTPNQPKKGTSK